MKVHLIGSPRTGSTYFARTLRYYIAPETLGEKMRGTIGRQYGNEPFRPDIEGLRGDNLKLFFETVINSINEKPKLVMKSHTWHFHILNDLGLMDQFRSLHSYNILLLRRNIFNTALSSSIARIKQEYFDYKDHSVIEIPLEDQQQSIDNYLQSLSDIKHNIFDLKFDEFVCYEDFTFNPKRDFFNTQLCKRSLDQLPNYHIEEHRFKSPDKKSTVRNFDEVYNFTADYLQQKNINWMKIRDVEIVDFGIDLKKE